MSALLINAMKKLLAIFSFSILYGLSFCQTAPGFNLRMTSDYYNTKLYKICIDNDTIVGLGTGSLDSTGLETGIVLIKFDTFGNILHSKLIQDTLIGPFPLNIRYGSLLKTPDNGYIMNIIPFLFAYPVIVKTDHEFNLEFIKKYEDSVGQDFMLAELKTVSDGYLLHGSLRRSNGKSDGYVRKIDFNGGSVWYKNLGVFDSSETVVDLKVVNDSVYAVAMVRNIIQSMFNGSARSLIKYLNKDGEIIQEWASGSEPEIGYLRDVLFVGTDYLLLYGMYVDSVTFNGTYVFKSTISKLDSDFNVLWVKHYGRPVSLSSEMMFYNFERTIDNNFIGVGVTFIEPVASQILDCGWLMKFSEEGDSIWSRLDLSDLNPVQPSNNNRLGGVGVLSSGSIIAGGYAEKWPDSYIWLIKVTNDGCLDTLYCGLVNTVEEGPKANINVRAFPNPATAYLEVDYSPMQGQAAKLYLTNLLGRRVGFFELDSYSTRHQIPLDGLPNGQYFYSILKDGQRVSTGKFIKLE